MNSGLVDLGFQFLYLILIIGALLTWFPRMPLDKPPLNILTNFCNIFFAPFRRIIPPVGGIDFSPILAFIILTSVWSICIEVL